MENEAKTQDELSENDSFVKHCRSIYYGGIDVEDFRWGEYYSERFEDDTTEEERQEMYSRYTGGKLIRSDYSGYVWGGLCVAFRMTEDKTDMIEYDPSMYNVALLVDYLTCDEQDGDNHDWLPYDEYRKIILRDEEEK